MNKEKIIEHTHLRACEAEKELKSAIEKHYKYTARERLEDLIYFTSLKVMLEKENE